MQATAMSQKMKTMRMLKLLRYSTSLLIPATCAAEHNHLTRGHWAYALFATHRRMTTLSQQPTRLGRKLCRHELTLQLHRTQQTTWMRMEHWLQMAVLQGWRGRGLLLMPWTLQEGRTQSVLSLCAVRSN